MQMASVQKTRRLTRNALALSLARYAPRCDGVNDVQVLVGGGRLHRRRVDGRWHAIVHAARLGHALTAVHLTAMRQSKPIVLSALLRRLQHGRRRHGIRYLLI